MRKRLLTALGIAAVVAIGLLLARGSGDGSGYLVRAIFDNASFLVDGEEVRVAGATVGTIESVGVTMPGEDASYEDGRWEEAPGKAVLVLNIDDPGFQDFRRDATCMIRPQSLIGEKFVDCRPTLPRAPGSEPPPPLREVPEGEPGAGQHLLPVEQNSTSVDPDLVNNIQRLPYSQRFRIILNEFGATLAGRGEDIEEIVKRSNPVLRDATKLFQILADQRDQISQLAADSEQILEPLSRERAAVSGFLTNAGSAAQASSERGPALEEALSKLPQFLREFRSFERQLEGFTNAATPVFSDLGAATPALTQATRALTPFSAASTVSLKSLGAVGEATGPKLRAADPIVRKARDLSKSGVVSTNELARFFVNIKKTGGWDAFVDVIYNTAASTNEFDEYGHFIRSLVTLVDCATYELRERSGCSANFTGQFATESAVFDEAAVLARIEEGLAERSGGTAAGDTPPPAGPSISEAAPQPQPEIGEGEGLEAPEGEGESESEAVAEASGFRAGILEYFLGR